LYFVGKFSTRMIPPKTVQEILDATRIEEVVEEFVALRKRGVNLIGLCPFHNERTPSFNVSPARNIFKCFGCGKGGDAVTFLRELENYSYPEALQWLARKYNIEIEEVERTPQQVAQQQLHESLFIVNDFALQHFQAQLFETDEGRSVALHYFRQRGLRDETIRRFGLGYAPDYRDLLLQRARAKGHSPELLKKVGLSSQDGSRDFFRGRVMFAIHNLAGKVAAFAGRTMSSDKTQPKYINSPETEIYVKNRTLYGLHQAKKAIRQHDECILVEGYMDVISLSQAGIENVVASSGTSLTEGQLQLIKRNTDNLKILYDGDPAGIRAALRGLDLALEQDLNVRLVLLPPGEDPDSYVQKIGPEAFGEFLRKEARDFVIFKANLLVEDTMGDPVRKAGLVKDIVATIAKIPDPIKRSVYLRECSMLMDISEHVLMTETNKLIATTIKKRQEKESRQPGAMSDSVEGGPNPELMPVEEPPFYATPGEGTLARNDEFQERDIIRLLVQHGQQWLEKEQCSVAEFVLADIEESLPSFDNPLYGRVAQECHALLLQRRNFDQSYFINHPQRAIADLAVDLLASPYDMSPNWEDMWRLPLQHQPLPELNFDADTRQALDRFKLRKLLKMCNLNLARVRGASESGDTEGMLRFLKIQQKLNEARNEVAKRLGTVVLPE
jgi:DNA primase